MEAESIFHRLLNAHGCELMLESGTCTLHLNHTSWPSWLPKRYYQGRLFAATWADSWSWTRRLLFILATPAIPCIRLWRLQQHIRRGQPCRFLVLLMPLLIVGLLTESIGHMVGCVAGPGDCLEKIVNYEFARLKHAKLT
jgi:hypothetical protein